MAILSKDDVEELEATELPVFLRSFLCRDCTVAA